MNANVIVGAAIVRDGALLAARRAHPPELAGYWELPGGRVEPGEVESDALRRECSEELGVEVRVGLRVGADVDLPGGKVLRIYAATLADATSEPAAVEHRELRWLRADELGAVGWLPADEVLLPDLLELLRAGAQVRGG